MIQQDTNIEGQQYYCRVFIDNIELISSLIHSLSIREFIFDTALELDLEFIDNGTFVEISPIVDGSVMRVVLAKDREENPMEIEFDILNTKVAKQNSPGNSIYFVSLVAIQKSDYMLGEVSQKYYQGPSSQVIGEVVSKNKQLTYVEDVTSNDSQIWYQISVNDSNFIKHILERAFYQEQDSPIIYATKNNTFHYTTLKTKCSQKTKFVAINNDMLAMDAGNQNVVLQSIIKEKDRNKTLFFKSDYTFNDNMPIENRTGGYGFDFTYFDATDFKDHVITFNYAPFTNTINKRQNPGKLYDSITYNMQNSNVHDNYLLAYNQNKYLKKNIFSYYTTITIAPNLNVQLMDKINVSFIKQYDIETKTVGIDDIHSGEYLVGGIYHNVHKGGFYTMILILFRNGFNLKENPVIQNNKLIKVKK
jgi:hypothetical protein